MKVLVIMLLKVAICLVYSMLMRMDVHGIHVLVTALVMEVIYHACSMLMKRVAHGTPIPVW